MESSFLTKRLSSYFFLSLLKERRIRPEKISHLTFFGAKNAQRKKIRFSPFAPGHRFCVHAGGRKKSKFANFSKKYHPTFPAQYYYYALQDPFFGECPLFLLHLPSSPARHSPPPSLPKVKGMQVGRGTKVVPEIIRKSSQEVLFPGLGRRPPSSTASQGGLDPSVVREGGRAGGRQRFSTGCKKYLFSETKLNI